MSTISRKLTVTPIDLSCDVMQLPRFPGESMQSYYSMLRSAYASNPNATYLGRIWALLHDLRLQLVPYILLDSTDKSTSVSICPSGMDVATSTGSVSVPFFTTNASGGMFFEDTFNSLLNSVTGLAGVTVSQDITLVDMFSPVFTNEFHTLTLHPYQLLYGTNVKTSVPWVMPSDREYIKLPHENLVSGSVILDSKDLDFMYEVASSGDLAKVGDYYVDYSGGVIISYTRLARQNALDTVMGLSYDDILLMADDDLKQRSIYNWRLLNIADEEVPSVTVQYQYYELPYRLMLTPVQLIPWSNRTLDNLFYNTDGANADYPRVEIPLITDALAEIRTNNASY